MPPTISCPTNIYSLNDIVSWTAPSVVDDLDEIPDVACIPVSGNTFSMGETLVTCSATDDVGNSDDCSFSVVVGMK